MKAIMVVAVIGIGMVANAQNLQVSNKCKTYSEEPARSGADLLRILVLPSAPDFSYSDWKGCRIAVLNRIDVKRNWSRNIQRMKWMLEQQRRNGETKKARCRAQGGSWRRTMNRCVIPNAGGLRAQREYERRRREWEQERTKKAEESRRR